MTFKLAILPLIWKRIVFKEMLLDRPVCILHRDRAASSISTISWQAKRELKKLRLKASQLILLGSNGDKLAFTGECILQMTGSSTLNNYTLDGHWDPSGAAYSYGDNFTKPHVFNIFKKLLQQPEKLITDTGEVIMGQ